MQFDNRSPLGMEIKYTSKSNFNTQVKVRHDHVQSNLCTTTTLGYPNLWPLLTGGRYKIDIGRRRQVVVIRRWSLTQV
jgi:hypothetical protein